MRRSLSLAVAATVFAASACKDSNVPFFTAPTSVPNSPAGIQNAVTGLLSGSRGDLFSFIVDATGFGRDGANYTNTEPRFITYELGLLPIDPAWASTWANSYANILQSHQIISTIPSVVPAFTTAQSQSLVGVIQTIEALNYMVIQEDHDSAGIAIMPALPTSAPPAFCAKDGWKYIVALLDSANNALHAAGATPLPVKLPSGFNAVSATATSFSAFNRALAGKAGLEYAYAIARGPGGSPPTPLTPGSPDIAALTRADSAIQASALLDTLHLTPNPAGGFTPDNWTVLHNFSAQSGDLVNPVNANIGTYIVLTPIPSSQDTINDLRWKTKFAVNPHLPVQDPGYSIAASNYIYNMYSTPGAFIPIVRNEELALVRAEIQIGLGNYNAAWAYINEVRTKVGGLAALPVNATYQPTRDAMLHEQQISTAFEASGDRMIAVRMYGLNTVIDQIWAADTAFHDHHTDVNPIPFAEVAARGGSFQLSCP
jgi:starch-binding outer membrane protein, SusD/RagB family